MGLLRMRQQQQREQYKMANASSLLGGDSYKRSFTDRLRGGLAGYSGNPSAIAGAANTEQEAKLQQQQKVMGETFSILSDLDSGNPQGAIDRVGRISMELAEQGLDNSNFLDLGEQLVTDPKAARKMILDAGKGAVASGQIDLKNNPMWAAVLGDKEQKEVAFKPVIDDEGNPFEVRSYKDVEGRLKTIARDGTDLSGMKLHGPNSVFFKKKMKEMESTFEAEDSPNALSPEGKLVTDLTGLMPDDEGFGEAVQRIRDSKVDPKSVNPRQKAIELSNFVSEGPAFQRYEKAILDSDTALTALHDADITPQKGALAVRTVSDLYNTNTKAASEIQRVLDARGISQSVNDWLATMSSGTISGQSISALKDIVNYAKSEATNSMYKDILNTLSYAGASYAETRSTLLRYNYPVKFDEKQWESKK